MHWLFVGWICLIVLSELKRIKASPKITVKAKVIKKTIVPYYHGQRLNHQEYVITFYTQTNEEIDLWMDDVEYGQYVIGDEGTLIYQGKKLIEFTLNP